MPFVRLRIDVPSRQALLYIFAIALCSVVLLWSLLGDVLRMAEMNRRVGSPESASALQALIWDEPAIVDSNRHVRDEKHKRQRCKQGGICRGKFLYLVQGETGPSHFWRKVGERSDSYLIWLTWGSQQDERTSSSTGRLMLLHLPNTTFNSGRNNLWKVGKQLEKKQGWKFEYFVFCDEDTSKLVIDKDEDRVAELSTERPRPISLLNYLLLQHRPARAGITVKVKHTPKMATCNITWSIDICVEAYHRTALDVMLPYSEKFDAINIWISGIIQNLKALVLLPQQAVEFRQIRKSDFHQKHANYPKLGSAGWRTIYRIEQYLNSCLPLEAHTARKLIDHPLRAATNPIHLSIVKALATGPCPRPSNDVDYTEILRDASSRWLSENNSCGVQMGRMDFI